MRDAFHSVADLAAVLAAGQAQAGAPSRQLQAEARGGSVGRGQGRIQGEQENSRAEARQEPLCDRMDAGEARGKEEQGQS